MLGFDPADLDRLDLAWQVAGGWRPPDQAVAYAGRCLLTLMDSVERSLQGPVLPHPQSERSQRRAHDLVADHVLTLARACHVEKGAWDLVVAAWACLDATPPDQGVAVRPAEIARSLQLVHVELLRQLQGLEDGDAASLGDDRGGRSEETPAGSAVSAGQQPWSRPRGTPQADVRVRLVSLGLPVLAIAGALSATLVVTGPLAGMAGDLSTALLTAATLQIVRYGEVAKKIGFESNGRSMGGPTR